MGLTDIDTCETTAIIKIQIVSITPESFFMLHFSPSLPLPLGSSQHNMLIFIFQNFMYVELYNMSTFVSSFNWIDAFEVVWMYLILFVHLLIDVHVGVSTLGIL